MKTFIKDTEARLFDKRVLRMLRMNRRSMVSFLEETGWRRHIKAFDDSSNHSAVALEKLSGRCWTAFRQNRRADGCHIYTMIYWRFSTPTISQYAGKMSSGRALFFFWSITGYCWLMRSGKRVFTCG